MARSSKRKRSSVRCWREEVRGMSNYLRLPEGITQFPGKPGTYRLDFMSYLAGKGNRRAVPGEIYSERTFYIHKEVGPNREWHLCLARTFQKPCPICEFRAKQDANPEVDEEDTKKFLPKERQLWLLKDLVNDPEGIMIWDVSTALFGDALKDKINAADEEDGYDYFADPVDGYTMRLALRQSDRGKWTETADIEFRDRKSQYEAAVVKDMPCLDDLLIETPYEKLKALFLQTSTDDEEEGGEEGGEEKPKRRSSKSKEPEHEVSVGDVVGYQGEKCEVVRVSGDGTSLILEDEDGEIHRAIGLDDLDELPTKRKRKPKLEEAEEPTKQKKRRPPKEDDEDDEDEPPKKTKRKAKPDPEDDEPPKKRKRKSKPEPDPEEDEDEDWDGEGWDDDEDDDKPSKKQKRKSKPEPEEDEDDEPPKKRKRRAKPESKPEEDEDDGDWDGEGWD